MFPYRRVSIPRSLDQFKPVNSKIWKVKSAGTLQIYCGKKHDGIFPNTFYSYSSPSGSYHISQDLPSQWHIASLSRCAGHLLETPSAPPAYLQVKAQLAICNCTLSQSFAYYIIYIYYIYYIIIYIYVYTHTCVSSCLLYIYSSVNIAFACCFPRSSQYRICNSAPLRKTPLELRKWLITTL
jgi:hypothetical protein